MEQARKDSIRIGEFVRSEFGGETTPQRMMAAMALYCGTILSDVGDEVALGWCDLVVMFRDAQISRKTGKPLTKRMPYTNKGVRN